MSNENDAVPLELARRRLDDAHARLTYQQQFSVEGFKALLLINGGAIVGLLTFAGNHEHVAGHLTSSFVGFTVGLILAVFAYLVAYFSQGEIMQMDMHESYRLLGVEARDKLTGDDHERRGNLAVYIAVALTVSSLAAFCVGAWCAISALSN